MIFAGIQTPFGEGLAPGGTENEANLQRALNDLATLTGRADLRVTVDGKVNTSTTMAVAAALTTISSDLDTASRIALAALTIFASEHRWQQANGLVIQYATQITKAIRAYILARQVIPSSSGTSTGTKPARVIDPRIFATLTPTSPSTPSSPDTIAANRIFAYDKRARMYRVAQQTSQLQGQPAPFTEIGVSAEKPINATEVRFYDYLVATGTLPWYRKWWGITLLGVGATAVVVGTIAVVRSKKSGGVHGLLGSELQGSSSNYTYHGTIVEPIPGTVRRVAGGVAVDVRVTDPRSTVKHATVNADNVIDKYGRRYLK